MEMKLEATGDPAPSYQWYRDSQEIKDADYNENSATSDTFVISEVTKDDDNSYYCVAGNGKSPAERVTSSKTNLKVVSPSAIVQMTLSVENQNSQQNCHTLFIDDFQKMFSTNVDKNVFITNMTDVDENIFCKITACSRDPCKNGGKCTVLGTEFHCTCPPSWSGKLCQDDVNECASGRTQCYGDDANCTNIDGSYKCSCPSEREGSRCEYYINACSMASCEDSENCVPSTINNHTCIPKASVLFLEMPGSLGQAEVDKHKVAEELSLVVQNLKKPQQRRKRRSVVTNNDDYGDCVVHILGTPVRTSDKVVFSTVLDCSSYSVDGKGKIVQTVHPDALDDLCDQLMKSNKAVSGCGKDKNNLRKTASISPGKAVIQIAIENEGDTFLDYEEAVSLIEDKKITSGNVISGVQIKSYEKMPTTAENKGEKKESNNTGTIVAVAVIVPLVIIAIIIIFVYRSRNRKKQGHAYTMQQRSVIRREGSKINLTTEVDPVTPGLVNAVYEEDGERGGEAFLFDMPKGLKKTSVTINDDPIMQSEPVPGYEVLPWFHGQMMVSKIDKLLESNEVGAFLAYTDSSENLFLAVHAPLGGPVVRHMKVAILADDKLGAKFGQMSDELTFPSLSELVDYFRGNAILFEDTEPEVTLTNPVLE